MENFLGTFLGGLGVSIVAGLAWLAFLHPTIFDRFFGQITLASVGIYILVMTYLIGHTNGASKQFLEDFEKLQTLDLQDRPNIKAVEMPIGMLTVFSVFGAVMIGCFVLAAISQASPKRMGKEQTDEKVVTEKSGHDQS